MTAFEATLVVEDSSHEEEETTDHITTQHQQQRGNVSPTVAVTNAVATNI